VSRVRVLGLAVLVVLVLAAVPTANAQGTWSTVTSPTGNALYSVFMVGAGEGWAVGDLGTMLHCSGGSWSLVTPSPRPTGIFQSVFMVSASEGWAVGWGSDVLHYSGGSWSLLTPSPDPLASSISVLSSVFMVDAGEGWAVGRSGPTSGTMFHYTGGSWSLVTPPTTIPLNSVFMVGTGEGWAVGRVGVILHYAGGSWSGVTSPAGSNLYSVSMADPSNGWSVGEVGTILHYSGGSWSLVTPSPTTNTLNSVFMVSASDGWAVGDGGTILHYSVSIPDFGISCDPISVTVMQGASGSSTCTVTSLGGFNSPVTLSGSWSGTPPTGVAYTFSAPSVTPPANGAATSTLTFTADASASTGGPFVYHVTGASGTIAHSTDVPVFVNVNPWSGVGPTVFTLPATDITDTTAFLHGTANPNGLATTWDFMSPSGTIYCPSPPESLPADTLVHDVSCTATSLTPSTHYEFAIRATDSAGQTSFGVYLWFDTLAAPGTPDFSIHCDPSTVTVVQGGSISSTCAVTSQNGFNSPVALSGAWVGAGGVPAGVTPELVPSSVTPSAGMTVPSTLTITASAAASTGTFTYRVNAVSTVGAATLSHTSDVAVQINLSGAGGAGFSIAANPTSLSLGAGASGASTITIQSLGSFSSPVSLTATGSGFNFAWGENPLPAPAPGGQSSTTLTVTVAGPPVGLQTVTITGTSTADPSMTSQTTLTVTVAGGGGGCLIATATYGSELSPEVQFLRGFRDNSILKTNTGSNFMIAFNAWYYSFSPFVADFVRENSLARTVTRLMLYPLMGILRIGASAFYTLPGNLEVGAVVSGLLVSSLIGIVYLSPPLAVVSACSRRMRRIAKRIELPVVAVMLGALVAAAFLAVVGAPSIFMMLSTATIVLATLAASAVYTSRALLHMLKRALVSENA